MDSARGMLNPFQHPERWTSLAARMMLAYCELHGMCLECNAIRPEGSPACPRCGTALLLKGAYHCLECGAMVPRGGALMDQGVGLCPQCRDVLPSKLGLWEMARTHLEGDVLGKAEEMLQMARGA